MACEVQCCIYIIIVDIIKSCCYQRFIQLFFSIYPYHPSLSVGPPNNTQCPHRAVIKKETIEERQVHPCFPSSVLYVLLVLLGWFWRWEVLLLFLWGCCFQDLFKQYGALSRCVLLAWMNFSKKSLWFFIRILSIYVWYVWEVEHYKP